MRVVTESGQEKVYYGLAFSPGGDSQEMEIQSSTWLDVIRQEYLDDFVRAGGAAVKVAVADDEPARHGLRDQLRPARPGHGYRVAIVDAAETKVQMVDRVFHAVARQMPWGRDRPGLPRPRTIAENGYQLPADPTNLTLAALAAANDVPTAASTPASPTSSGASCSRDYAMSQELRLAMVRLCRGQLSPDDPPSPTPSWPGCTATFAGSQRSSAP